jgi:hypothetical protein
MAVDPFDRLRGCEWQRARQHLVESHTERIKVAAAVDRTVHASRLLGSHIRKRARERLGRLRRLSLARKSRSNPEAGQPHLPGRCVDQHVGWLDVLMDDSPAVHPAERARKTDGEPEEEA